MIIKPFGNRILFKPDAEVGIIERSNEQLLETGTVVAIGDDVKSIKVGDKIIFTEWGAHTIEVEGEKYYFTSEDPEWLYATYQRE